MKYDIKHIFFMVGFLLMLFIRTSVLAQGQVSQSIQVRAIVINGDTLPYEVLPNVILYTKLTKAQKARFYEWTRLRNAVYVTYPYAISASRIINDINKKLVGVDNRKKRKEIIRSREKELKKEFSDKLMNLSTYQGRVLMKLIFRETGNNCYEIIEEYKGIFTAAFWQTVAVIFGNNLKQNYEPTGADRDMEIIVKEVQEMYGYKG